MTHIKILPQIIFNRRSITFTVLSLFFSIVLFAQKSRKSTSPDTIFYNQNMEEVKKEKGFAYLIIYHEGMSKKAKGLVEIKAKDGRLFESMNLKKGILNGPYIKNDHEAKTSYKGRYRNGIKVGNWELISENGEVLISEKFSDTGQMVNVETNPIFLENLVVSEGTEVDVLPTYTGGMTGWNNFLKKNLKYPRTATRGGHQGAVFLRFIVLESGQTVNIENITEDEIHESLVKEAIRVVLASGNWAPAQKNGKAVPAYMQLRIVFRLR